MEITKYQNALMQHCCGLNKGEKRNFFGTSKGYKDSDEFEKLVDAGLAVSHTPPSWSGDTALYTLTDEGKKVAAENMPEPEPIKKRTRSQQNYRDYLDSPYFDAGDSFAAYMGFSQATD